MLKITENREETVLAGRNLAATLKGGETLLLYGDLGSGKTTFTGGLISFFLPGKRVLSPTFIIARHYPVRHEKIHNIIHVDLYRLEKDDLIKHMDFMEFINRPDTVTVIEWAEKMINTIPEKPVRIYFRDQGTDHREIEVM